MQPQLMEELWAVYYECFRSRDRNQAHGWWAMVQYESRRRVRSTWSNILSEPVDSDAPPAGWIEGTALVRTALEVSSLSGRMIR